MESPICGLCLDKGIPLQLTKTVFTKEISNILQKCCDFLFQVNATAHFQYQLNQNGVNKNCFSLQ